MTREKLLTLQWNNMLSLALGIPTLIYIAYVFSTSAWSEQSGFIGILLFGAVF